jgi:hypothetical protein
MERPFAPQWPASWSLKTPPPSPWSATRSQATWQKYECGWRAFENFESSGGKKFAWPLDVLAIRGFITWST